jgi:predicted phosphatase
MNKLSFDIYSALNFDRELEEAKERTKDTILDRYQSIIFDLDNTLWKCFTPSGEGIGAYKTTPPYSLQSKNIIIDIRGNIIELQEGVRELLEILDLNDKNLGVVSSGEKLIDENKRIGLPSAAQPSIMLLKKFDLYKYFNLGVITKGFINKRDYVKGIGKVLFIDDSNEQIQNVNEKGNIDVLDRKSFGNWEDLLRKTI